MILVSFLTPSKKPQALSLPLPLPPPILTLATTDLLSVDLPLLNIHADGVRQLVVFYDWLLPLSIVF